VGCDMPFVTTELFCFLLGVGGEYEAVVPTGPDDQLEPLCAVYSTRATNSITLLIENGARKVGMLFDQVSTRIVSFRELCHLPGAQFFFHNVNTAHEYARAVEIIRTADRLPKGG
jgi:molybdopterin-guanine dinucleotide biosynthesis protein A